MKQIERVQTGLRLEKRLLKVLKGLAEYLEIPVAELIEGMALHALEGKAPPFTPEMLDQDRRAEGGLRAGPDRRRRPSPDRRRHDMKIVAPKRASHSYTQSLLAPPEAVFPLLCPVREAEWLVDWDPLFVASTFRRRRGRLRLRHAVASRTNTIWYVTDYEPKTGFIAFVRVTPGVTATRLSIQLAAAPEGSTARITYTHTSLGEKGDAVVDGFTEAAFTDFMQRLGEAHQPLPDDGQCLAA